MSPVLPSSLSPHICILSSPDLAELLVSSALPPLPHILQSFSPLPQVTTRTTSLVSVPHASFALRFSELTEIETACKEDEEQRAVRTIDWIGARINKRCHRWVEEIEKQGDTGAMRTPWWDELRRCAEGDHIPSKNECWNHPVAVILAVSTTVPNPLQTISALHSRRLEFPSWVDPNILRYTLIVHPQNSRLSDEEAGALFNAVKKQFGLHSYLLPLTLPTPPPPPVPVPALIPRLPPPPSPESSHKATLASSDVPQNPNALHTLKMAENDIQQTARFAREFVVMSLLPWMEKCVVEWNENFSSTRRLPSRLFSSTRRLFGSPSPSPSPTHQLSSSVSSLPPRGTQHANGSGGPNAIPPPQQRRLAEFATILGDLKLSVTVWEALRKEGKGGSDILPMLLAPSPTLPLHASNALSGMHLQSSEPPAHAQLRALIYAVRWEACIDSSDLIGGVLEGERWLVWAAGNAEEPPAALLLAHAALLSARKHAKRRASLWYLSAANRLEKCGIKPLTMYFLRRAHELYKSQPQKALSPLFWETEGESLLGQHGIDAIMSGIEHPLGRLLYTTGDVAGAVRLFLGLLRGSSGYLYPLSPLFQTDEAVNETAKLPGTDKVFLDDFRVAFAHFKSTSGDNMQLNDLDIPFSFCVKRQTQLRLPGGNHEGVNDVWVRREEDWKAFRKASNFEEGLAQNGMASVNEPFWIDLVLSNPLDAEVNLSNLTVVVEDSGASDPSSSQAFVEVDVIEDIVLAPKESRTVPICLKSKHPASLSITHVKYDFLSLLPSQESLSSRGRRLHGTASERQKATYSPDVIMKIDIVEASHKLVIQFVDDEHMVLAQGERKHMKLWLSNMGTQPIGDLWMVAGSEDEVWLGLEDESGAAHVSDSTEIISSHNSLAPSKPTLVPLPKGSSTINPGESIELSLIYHTELIGDQELCLLFVYRDNDSKPFRSVRVKRPYEVYPMFDTSVKAEESRALDYPFQLTIDISNTSPSKEINLTQVTCLSPAWKCTPITGNKLYPIQPSQSLHLPFGASSWTLGSGSLETFDFVSSKLGHVLQGRVVEDSKPPEIDILCSHTSQSAEVQSVKTPCTSHLLHRARQTWVFREVSQTHPYIPSDSYPIIFPLYNPASLDFVVFWEIPTEHRHGHISISGITLGATHAALKDIITEAEGAKVKRSMYAETQREREEVLEAIKGSKWNAEMNPVTITRRGPEPLFHEFKQGPLRASVTMVLRNYSLTHRSRFILRFITGSTSYSSDLLSPPYTGRLVFRGILEPSETTTIHPSLWIVRPGTYSLGGWSLETEVLDTPLTTTSDAIVHVRHRYRQEPPAGDKSCLIICDIDPPQ